MTSRSPFAVIYLNHSSSGIRFRPRSRSGKSLHLNWNVKPPPLGGRIMTLNRGRQCALLHYLTQLAVLHHGNVVAWAKTLQVRQARLMVGESKAPPGVMVDGTVLHKHRPICACPRSLRSSAHLATSTTDTSANQSAESSSMGWPERTLAFAKSNQVIGICGASRVCMGCTLCSSFFVRARPFII